MRIVAGNSQINILSDEQNNGDFIVFAQLVDSDMGYEKPILVRNSQELLIWFGDQFKDYNYLKELLDQDRVSLYLYRGIETEGTEKIISENYYYIPDVSPNTLNTLNALRNGDETDTTSFIDHYLPESVTENENAMLYKVIRSDGINYDSTFNVRYSYYIYNEESNSFVLYDSLDETKKNKSLLNRDRLSVGYYRYIEDRDTIITYSYYNPEMSYVTEKESNTGVIEIEDFDNFQKNILEGRATKHLIISGENLTIEDLKNDPHIPLVEEDGNYTYELPEIEVEVENNNQTDKLTYFFSVPYYREQDLDHRNVVNGIILPRNNEEKVFSIVRNSGSDSSINYGLATENFLGEYDRNVQILEKNFLYNLCSYNRNVDLFPELPEFFFYDNFYNVPKNFKITTNFKADQEDIYKFYVEGGEIYRFESKTIGKGSENIQVEIRWIETYTEKNNIYSVIISRYDYQEFFEGPFEDEFGIERLDHKISRESKLIRFKIIPQIKPEQGWPEGKWDLKGSYIEKEKDLDYSFNLMCKTLEDFSPDFILVPKKEDYPTEYKILDWVKNLNCQALITNNSENWESNIEDKENRLIYFYNPVIVGEQEKPGYYVFLKGLIYEDTYLLNVQKLLYEFPKDKYEEDEENREEKINQLYQNLKQKKSNYLNSNNQYYYYNSYFSGEDYVTTPLVRFVVSKITRELEKNKWKIIGEKENKISEETFYPILRPIEERFSIIRSINVNQFVVDGISRTVEASITTTLSDIISSDVSFDIILNYSKLNN